MTILIYLIDLNISVRILKMLVICPYFFNFCTIFRSTFSYCFYFCVLTILFMEIEVLFSCAFSIFWIIRCISFRRVIRYRTTTCYFISYPLEYDDIMKRSFWIHSSCELYSMFFYSDIRRRISFDACWIYRGRIIYSKSLF